MAEQVETEKMVLVPRLQKALHEKRAYFDIDMGSKKYTMEGAVTVNMHWSEKEGSNMKLYSLCLGTEPFTLKKDQALTPIRQQIFNTPENVNLSVDDEIDIDMDVESDESSSWGNIEDESS